MFKKEKWPFTPLSLSKIINKDGLSVIEAGCCERLKKAMTIIDAGQQIGDIHRIDSINVRQHFEGFCALLRDEKRVLGGNTACEKCDIEAAKKSLESIDRDLFRNFRCHMGLLDATYVIRVQEQPVAFLFSGQYQPPEGIEQIQKNVRGLGTGSYEHIKLLDKTVELELCRLAEKLPQAPEDFRDRLQREAEHIQGIAEAEYRRVKNLWEQEFLDELRASESCTPTTNLKQLRQCTSKLLKLIWTFCHCEYAVFFGSTREDDTVLAPIAGVGIPTGIKENLPHFNWKKAELPIESSNIKGWDIIKAHKTALKGIRGDNSQFFSRASCILPTALGNRYHGVLVFGPFAEHVNLQTERRFLMEIANIIGSFVLTELEVRYLRQERRQWEGTAKLLTHQLRTTLTPITTRVGSARLLIQEFSQDTTTRDIVDSLKRAEDLCLQLGKSTRETLGAHVLLVEPEDLEFERYPLSVLVANCVEGFVIEVEKRHRHLVVDKSIELLPEAEVDVARLTIVLSNLIENALKYSYPNTTIFVRSAVHFAGDIELATAIIEVDNLGDQIQLKDRESIFEQGTRGLTRAKMGRIPGTGLGLWEARAVVEAHGGTITFSSEPTSIYRRQGQAYHVIFFIKIPLRRQQ